MPLHLGQALRQTKVMNLDHLQANKLQQETSSLLRLEAQGLLLARKAKQLVILLNKGPLL
jgi:hypothetical protein